MAFQHAILVFTLLFIWQIISVANGMNGLILQGRGTHLRPQLRPTRDSDFKYHNMELKTARLYGKRSDIEKHYINNILKWIYNESRRKNVELPGITNNNIPSTDEEIFYN